MFSHGGSSLGVSRSKAAVVPSTPPNNGVVAGRDSSPQYRTTTHQTQQTHHQTTYTQPQATATSPPSSSISNFINYRQPPPPQHVSSNESVASKHSLASQRSQKKVVNIHTLKKFPPNASVVKALKQCQYQYEEQLQELIRNCEEKAQNRQSDYKECELLAQHLNRLSSRYKKLTCLTIEALFELSNEIKDEEKKHEAYVKKMDVLTEEEMPEIQEEMNAMKQLLGIMQEVLHPKPQPPPHHKHHYNHQQPQQYTTQYQSLQEPSEELPHGQEYPPDEYHQGVQQSPSNPGKIFNYSSLEGIEMN